MHQHLLRANLQEVVLLGLPMLKDISGLAALGLGDMALQQTVQLIEPMIDGDRAGHDGLGVHQLMGRAFGIIEIGHPPGHPGSKVRADLTKDHRHTAGHIFAPVAAAAFDHHIRARVADGETLARPARGKEVSRRRAIEHRVANDRILRRHHGACHRRPHHDRATRQTLADIVIGIARDFELEPRCGEGPQ